MFLPLIIAILLGFASPSDTNTTNHCRTTVSANGTDETPPTGGVPGDDGGGPGTVGDTGQNPPPKP